jgi:hypothetical protein
MSGGVDRRSIRAGVAGARIRESRATRRSAQAACSNGAACHQTIRRRMEFLRSCTLPSAKKKKRSTSSSAIFANAAIPSSLSSKSVRSLIPCAAIHVSRPCLQKLSLPEKNENKAAAGSTQCSIRSGRLQRSDRPWPLFRAILIKSGADTRRFRRIRINRLPGDANAAFRQPSSRAPLALSALSKGDQTRVRNPQFSAVGRLKSAVI